MQHGTAAPRRVAIIGAGPSGLFAAQALVAQQQVPVEIDVFDRLPTPFGLLRYGVAPDHTSIKSVAIALARTFDSPLVRFYGMVTLGREVTVPELLGAYDAVIYAVGASADAHLGIPGEELPGSVSAREFVAWYSGHPDAVDQHLGGVTSAAAIGVGNVAVDVARVLAKHPDYLDETDMPVPVLAELHRSRVRDVWVIGRRGPHHASFTTKELRELLELPGVAVDVPAESFDGIDEDVLDRRQKANVAALRDAAGRPAPEQPRSTLHFRFWARPTRLTRGENETVAAMTLEHTRLTETGRVEGTGELTTIDVQRVLRAVGYRSHPPAGVPFDEDSGVVPNVEGRITDIDGTVHHREYVVGWIKRGPIGVIGTNKSDAAQTVGHLLEDLADIDVLPGRRPLSEVWAERGVVASTFDDWQRIDRAETALGTHLDRARTKIESWHELLDLIRQ